MAVDQIFGSAAEDDLPGDADGGIFLEADGGFLLVSVVEDDGDTSFRDSGLTAFVDEILWSQRTSESENGRGKTGQGIGWLGSGRTCKFCARTVDMLVIPRTKQMESRMLDFPLPLRPVMELKLSSLRLSASAISSYRVFVSVGWIYLGVVYHPDMTVRTAYDLKPCKAVSQNA